MKSLACGLESVGFQYEEPEWEPLLAAVGERLTGTFMWMHEDQLADGSSLQAYKHIYTRRYLYLSEESRAYERAPCGRFVRQRLDYALKAALCSWWILSGWDAEDAEAVRHAIITANRETGTAP